MVLAKEQSIEQNSSGINLHKYSHQLVLKQLDTQNNEYRHRINAFYKNELKMNNRPKCKM